MITPDLITQPFANTGDKSTPPQTSGSGFVNFQDGYTPFYEISLAANNPNAKAVERQVQNYMFNLMTQHLQAWQQQSIAPWYSALAGGYPKNSLVMRVNGSSVPTIYKSLVTNNITDPLNSPASWEYQPGAAEALLNVPMPAGGATGPTGAVITIATSLNTMLYGTFEFQTDAIAAASTGIPVPPGGAAAAGMLEAITWSNGGSTYNLQRYQDRNGFVAVRSGTAGTFGNWTFNLSITASQADTARYIALGGTATVYTATLVPAPTALVDGMEFRSTVNLTNTGTATMNVNGLGAKAIIGGGLVALQGGELAATGIVTFRYSTAKNSWVITGSAAGAEQGSPATQSLHTPIVSQVQSGYGTRIALAGTASVYTATLSPAPAALVDGMEFRSNVNLTNTSTATLNVNGLGAKPILGGALLALQGGELTIGGEATFRYSTALSSWIISNSSAGADQVAAASQSNHAPSVSQVQAGYGGYAALAGSANTYTAALTPVPAALVDGMEVRALVNVANTGATTFNLNGLGAKSVVGATGALQGGEFAVGGDVTLRYNLANTNWTIIGAAGGNLQTPAGTQSNHAVNYGQILNKYVPQDTTTGAASLPTGTTAQRPANGQGKLRYNTDNNRPEINNGTTWTGLGGATGGGGDAVFYLNDQSVNNDYTVIATQNAMSAGPVAIASGKTVTIASGAVWTIV